MPPEPPAQPPQDPDATAAAAQALWAALRTARATGTPTDQATAEDALFRLHLPMATALARQHLKAGTEPAAALQAAELGLSHAILGWHGSEGTGFGRYARGMINRQLRPSTNPTGRRGNPAPPEPDAHRPTSDGAHPPPA